MKLTIQTISNVASMELSPQQVAKIIYRHRQSRSIPVLKTITKQSLAMMMLCLKRNKAFLEQVLKIDHRGFTIYDDIIIICTLKANQYHYRGRCTYNKYVDQQISIFLKKKRQDIRKRIQILKQMKFMDFQNVIKQDRWAFLNKIKAFGNIQTKQEYLKFSNLDPQKVFIKDNSNSLIQLNQEQLKSIDELFAKIQKQQLEGHKQEELSEEKEQNNLQQIYEQRQEEEKQPETDNIILGNFDKSEQLNEGIRRAKSILQRIFRQKKKEHSIKGWEQERIERETQFMMKKQMYQKIVEVVSSYEDGKVETEGSRKISDAEETNL